MRQFPTPALTVLHASHTGEAGVGKCVGDFAADQVARGWHVIVATNPDSELAAVAATAGADLEPWIASRQPTRRVAGETRRLGGIINSVSPDIVHLHSSKAGLCGRLVVRRGRLTVFQPHCWSFEAVSGGLARAATAWERFAAKWTDALVCVSEAERQEGVDRGILADYRVVPNGVDLRRFRGADEEDQRAARQRLGLGSEPLVVCVGRLSRQKGQDVLVEAWPLIRERVPEAQLALLGDGEYMELLRARAAAGEGVRLLGQRSDVVEWLTACDVVAMPSRWEGMALGMLEAMAVGRSLVVSDVHGAREAVDGVGAVVPPEDTRALAEAIVRRLLDRQLREIEGRAARQRARERFDLRTTLSSIADIYLELVRSSPGKTSDAGSKPRAGRATP